MLQTITPTSLLRGTVFDQFARNVDRLVEAAVGQVPFMQTPASWPGLNVWRDGDDVFVEAEIPGFRMEDIEILSSEDTLTIRGHRETPVPEGATPLRVERSITRFERSVQLPMPINPDAVDATLTDGVLRVKMPMAESARPKRVQIKSIGTGGRKVLSSGGKKES